MKSSHAGSRRPDCGHRKTRVVASARNIREAREGGYKPCGTGF